jgi:hypothetical protein
VGADLAVAVPISETEVREYPLLTEFSDMRVRAPVLFWYHDGAWLS